MMNPNFKYLCGAHMKKSLVYVLLFVYLFSFPEMRQLLKVPNLVEHYISHKIKDRNTTLYSFIKMHYLDEQKQDADYKQDMQLPFKKIKTKDS